MRYNLLYITSVEQSGKVVMALERMHAKKMSFSAPLISSYELTHRLLDNIVLEINVLADIDGVTAHLRQHPVDLLIYDERGLDATPAPEALERIRKDVKSLADLWGPDFLFPMSRVVAILEKEERQTERAFELGRLQVRDVCVAPKSTSTLVLWLKRVLTKGVIRKKKVGLALSGGGLEGFLYQAGCLYALERAVGSSNLSQADVIAGVSSGSIAGSICASSIGIEEVIKAFHQQSDSIPHLTSSTIFDVAGFEIMKRIVKQSIGWAGLSPQKWISKTLASIPTGFLRGENLEKFLKEVLESAGGKDSFADFKGELYIGATDQDSYEHVTFGQKPWDSVPVSEAIRASIALPPIFMPKHINGRWFIDGQVTKTTNLELLVEKNCSLVVIVNPLKPYKANVPGATDKEGGVYGFIQTIKALVSTRFESSLAHLTERYPDVDFMVFEPDEECAEAMAGSPMRYRIRTQIVQLAYESTLRKLRERHPVYSVTLGKYGMNLKSVDELKQLEKVDTSQLGESAGDGLQKVE